MTETKDITTPSEDYNASVDAALADIVKDEPEEAVEELEAEPEVEDSLEEPQEAPEEPEEDETPSVDEEAIGKAYSAFLRDGLTQKEVDAKLKSLGIDEFIARGAKRAKKHATDDEAYAELKQLRTELSGKGTKEPAEKGERSQAGTPSLNLRDLAAPLAEKLALDDDGLKDLVASLEAVSGAKDGEINALREHVALVTSVLEDVLQDGVRKEVGLDQIDEDALSSVQKHYQALARTDLHDNLTGKARMAALYKSAAKLAGVAAKDEAEIQRKASIASAKKSGTMMVSRQRPLPKGPMTVKEQIDHMAEMVTKGAFKDGREAELYADRLRKRG